jgi:cell division protein FtsX
MDTLEKSLAQTLHDRLDPLDAPHGMPAGIAKRARRSRVLTASLAIAAVVAVGGSLWMGAPALGDGLQAAGSGDCPAVPAVELTIYLRDGSGDAAVENLKQILMDHEDVEELRYVSKAEAFAEFKQRYASQPEYYENLPGDALPARFEVNLRDGADPSAFEGDLPTGSLIDEVRYGDGDAPLCLFD